MPNLLLLGGGDSRCRRPRPCLTVMFLALLLTSSVSQWFPSPRLITLESLSSVTFPPFRTKLQFSSFSIEGSSHRHRPSRNLLAGYGFWLQPSRINRGKIPCNFTSISTLAVCQATQLLASGVPNRPISYTSEATTRSRSELEDFLLPSDKTRFVVSLAILRQLKSAELQPPAPYRTYLQRLVGRTQQLLLHHPFWIYLLSDTPMALNSSDFYEVISPGEGPHCLYFSSFRDRYGLLHQCTVKLSKLFASRVLWLKLLEIDGVPDFVVLFALCPDLSHRCFFPISYRHFNCPKVANDTGFVTISRHTRKVFRWMNSMLYQSPNEPVIRLYICCSGVQSTAVLSFFNLSCLLSWRRRFHKGFALISQMGLKSIISTSQKPFELSKMLNRLFESTYVLASAKFVIHHPLCRIWTKV